MTLVIIHLHHLAFRARTYQSSPYSIEVLSFVPEEIMMTDTSASHKSILALPNEVSRALVHSALANVRTD